MLNTDDRWNYEHTQKTNQHYTYKLDQAESGNDI